MQDLLILEDVIPSLPLTVECIGSYLIKNKNYKIFVSTKGTRGQQKMAL